VSLNPPRDNSRDLALIVSAAEQLLASTWQRSVRLSDPTALTDPDRRNVVIRCRVESDHGPASVVIKQVVAADFDPDDSKSWDVRRFFNDWCGNAFLSSLGKGAVLSPRFYAGERLAGYFVLEDLGPHHSLVEPLLEGKSENAAAAVRAFGRVLGRLHVSTIGRAAAFARMKGALVTADADPATAMSACAEYASQLERVCPRLNVTLDAGFFAEWDSVAQALAEPGPFLAYIHGDPCPDNVFCTEDGMRLIDFEFGRYGHALLDAAYARMMFPTCWCAGSLPRSLVREMETDYRAELGTQCREAQDDRMFGVALAMASAFWALTTLARSLPGALDGDPQWGIATLRPRIVGRLEAFIQAADEFRTLPALGGTASRCLDQLAARWPETRPLPLYPAWSKDSPSSAHPAG